MATVEQRLQRLEDIEEIRPLKQKYAKLCDEDYLAVERLEREIGELER